MVGICNTLCTIPNKDVFTSWKQRAGILPGPIHTCLHKQEPQHNTAQHNNLYLCIYTMVDIHSHCMPHLQVHHSPLLSLLTRTRRENLACTGQCVVGTEPAPSYVECTRALPVGKELYWYCIVIVMTLTKKEGSGCCTSSGGDIRWHCSSP